MQRTRRAFLRAAVIAPVVTGAWVIWEQESGRVKMRQSTAICCVPNGKPGKSCAHPVQPKPTDRKKPA